MGSSYSLDEWIIIPIGDKKALFGREAGTKLYRVTSEVESMDSLNPPRWAVTASGNRYDLLVRAGSITKYAYAAALDTLLRRGYSPQEVAEFLGQADRIVKECNIEEVISMFLRC